MIVVVRNGFGRKWTVDRYGEWMVYTLPARVTKRTRRLIETDALLAGCRYYLPSDCAYFFQESPLAKLSAEEYRLLRLPDAAVAAVGRLHLPPAQCPAQVLAPMVNLCCEKTVMALSEHCRDVTLVTPDQLRAHALAGRLLREYGLPLRITHKADLLARGVICSLGERSSLKGGRWAPGRIYLAQDLYEVDYRPPFAYEGSATELAGMLYDATRADWLRSLAVTKILPLDK